MLDFPADNGYYEVVEGTVEGDVVVALCRCGTVFAVALQETMQGFTRAQCGGCSLLLELAPLDKNIH